jgi:predicted dehydrogenase
MRVLLVGAGGIGRRHAQSIVTSKNVDVLNVVDPSRKALRETATLLAGMDSAVPVNYHSTLDARSTHDIAIIATSANERHGMLRKIRDRVKYLIIEKFLFNKLEEYRIDLRKNVAYVNSPRRAMGCFDQFKGEFPTIVHYGAVGLLSNAVHFADLLCYLSGSESVTYALDIDKPRKSKRAGYWDTTGQVMMMGLSANGRQSKGTCFITTETDKDSKYNLIINSSAVDEERRVIETKDGREEPFGFKYQSELTASHIDDIAKIGMCKLATFDQASQWHLALIDALRRKGWKKPVT